MTHPDFVIIGAMKCGTSTLHAQLRAQGGFYLASPKEPNFFSDDDNYRRGLDGYLALFAAASPGAIVGEASTHYTKLPTYPKAAARLHRHLPDARLVYMMRHPMDRLVSHYIHGWTMREMDGPLDASIERCAELVDYGRYAMQLEPYLALYGPERVLPVFLERLASRPQEELTRICRFVGHLGPVSWAAGAERENESSRRLRQTTWREKLDRHPAIKRSLRALIPTAMRQSLNRRWQMQHRPECTAACRRDLERIFDADLEVLGRWLGVELSTTSFKEIARSDGPLEFARAAARA